MSGPSEREGLAESLGQNRVACMACQRRCTLAEGQLGFCGVRQNRGGGLVSLSYGRVAALHLANVERKPLFHFYPGEVMLSVGSLGCNFRCPGCQNWALAHATVPDQLMDLRFTPPEELVEQASGQGLLGISFTYNEPAIWFEYTLDTFKLAAVQGLLTNYVTNGSLTPQGLDQLGLHLDAYRVDIKGFSKGTYQQAANFPAFHGILKVAERAKTKWGAHVECVTNIIPTVNDNPEELRGIASWIRNTLGQDTPWHVTRFVPEGQLAHLPRTPLLALEQAHAIGLEEGLQFVYIGNVPGHPAENTYCPECGRTLIWRAGIGLPKVEMCDASCPDCGTQIPGRFRRDTG